MGKTGWGSALALGLALIGYTSPAAAHEGNADAGQIHACVGTKSGKVRFIGSAAALKCKKSESALHFAASGPPGAQGPAGAAGAEGVQGAPGRSALTPLQSGETISGVWGVSLPLGVGEDLQSFVQFPIPLAAPLPEAKIEYIESTPTANCPGPGQAANGFLCLYQVDINNAQVPDTSTIFNPEMPAGLPGAGRSGFAIGILTDTGGPTMIRGTYTVTAP
jgi:hypothetical protein